MAIRHCRLCGAEYDCCVACEKLRSWRAVTDTADHYYILGVLMEYQSNRDAKSAREALEQRGVSVKDAKKFLPGAKKLAEEIFRSVQVEEIPEEQAENTAQEE